MNVEKLLAERSNNHCELCTSTAGLHIYEVPPHSGKNVYDSIFICEKCKQQLDKKEELDSKHWQCLNESMWSEVPAVQVVSWRMLNRFRNETWASEKIDMLYLDEENMAWAKETGDHENSADVDLHKDAYGALLSDGDTVVTTKSLDVKGSTLNAKLGTVVRNIKLVKDNIEQIEGKIEGQTVVILTKYLRKK